MVLLDSGAIAKAIEEMADQLLARPGDGPWAVIGIRRGGENLSRRLAAIIQSRTGAEVQLGMVDITLYRDDGFGPNDFPSVGITNIPFALKDYTIVLVDDVLYTGRTVRAAIDAILDYGRPKAVRLAVLVDRGLRELPIGADATGTRVETTQAQHIDVVLAASESIEDRVMVTPDAGVGS